MPTIKVQVRGKVAMNDTPNEIIVCRNSGYEILFDFDEEWNGFETKTAYFVYGGKSIAVPFNGNLCEVPVLENTTQCKVGVEAGDIKTTTSAYLPCYKAITDEGGEHPEQPKEDVYNKIVELVNEVSKEAVGSAKAISFEVSDGYVLTVKLQDKGGQVISTASVDLPIENLVSAVRYDETEKGLVFTFQGGQTLFVPISDFTQGVDGVGISSIEQTHTSVEDSGANEITVFLTDGKSFKFYVKNGSKGSDGKDGATIVSQRLYGQDEQGGNIYEQTYSDGKKTYFTAPKGDAGTGGTGGGTYGNTKIDFNEKGVVVEDLYAGRSKTEYGDGKIVYSFDGTAFEYSFPKQSGGLLLDTMPPTSTTAGAVKIDDSGLKQFVVDSDGFLTLYPAPNGAIDSRAGDMPITISNLDYAVISVMTGYNRAVLTEEQQATICEWIDAVGKTEYATATTAGVVKGDKTFGFNVNANGIPLCDILSASEYTGKTVSCFISKGTLENAKNDIVKRAIAENDIQLSDTEKAKALAWLGVDDKIGDIETVLDSVIAIQNSVIGGGV